MDPPPTQGADLPLPTHHIATTTTMVNNVLPGSTESSPKSSHHAEWDEPLAPLPGAKLRLMCSYGGHIIPRPHDKSLCYVGGETRIVVLERNSTLQDLSARLSRTLLDGRQFTLKYQLPNEELDSLISVATDEDLENMVEEYDRIIAGASPLKPSSGRLRLFLFFVKPETSVTMGALLDDAKTETWFVDALNGTNMLRGLSDSAAMDDLLSLGSGVNDPRPVTTTMPTVGVGSDASAQAKISSPQDGHSIQSMMSDSPMIETSSSFDSSTSSPSMAHLPPIRVRVHETGGITRLQDDMKDGMSLGEQLSSQLRMTPPLPTAILPQSVIAATQPAAGGIDMNYPNRVILTQIPVASAQAPGGGTEKNYSNHAILTQNATAPTQTPPGGGPQMNYSNHVISTENNNAATQPSGGGTEINYSNRAVSDDEKSDNGVNVPRRKPPLPLPLQHGNQRFTGGLNLPSPDSKHAGGFSLPSPDSVKSDSSMASATSFSKVPNQQEPEQVTLNESHPPNTSTTTEQNPLDNSPYTPPNQSQLPPMQDPTPYIYPPLQHHDQSQHQHQQYIHPNMHYIPTHAPIQSYYPAYATAQQPMQAQIDQHSQYPIYILSQPNSSQYHQQHPIQPTESTVTSSAIPPSPAPLTNNPRGMVQLPPNSSQYHQYVGHYNQASGRPMPVNPVAYGNYDYSRDIQQQHQMQHPVYYTGQVPTGSQYQSITPAQAAMIAEASMQLPASDGNQQPPRN